jgi:hypothetical protein
MGTHKTSSLRRVRTLLVMGPTPIQKRRKKKSLGQSGRRPIHVHLDRNCEWSGEETTENCAIAAIDADFDANAAADATAVVEVGTNCVNIPLNASAPNDALSGTRVLPAAPESSSKIDSSALFLVASSTCIAHRTDSTQTKKVIWHSTSGAVMLVMEFTEKEHTVFCSALSTFLQQNDVKSKNSAVLLEFLIEQEQEQENQDHPMSKSSPEIPKPLHHANGQLVDFNKLGYFNLDFNCMERSDDDAPVTSDEESDSDSSENIVDDNE